ncbi:hypothetical protein [Hydrogenoanaerobacterium sp.]|uniref:hypothetical protein n=1 Tax=Hydrogenoanaerobacterium sp. TaxID=2953763 RepID=UPI00289C4EB1|nr:hypothetical protein [Hydrogenoanaerobacterium sp.]
MTEYDIYTLKIDEEFKNLIPPLSPDERKQLEENLLQDGCREPLCVWNKTILDGHNRYEICTRHQIPFKIAHIFLRSREEAVAWICANQLGRRNITDESRRYLIGKRYKMEQIIGAHNAVGTNQYTRKEVRPKILTEPLFEETACRTRERLGKEYRISHATVDKYGIYANAIDSLSRVDPELAPKILSGQIKISQENILELSRLSPSDIRRVSAELTEGDAGYSGTRNIVPKRKKAKKQDYLLLPEISVKNMPAYDPDAEILSLVFTIPSWISSIERTRSSADFTEVSSNARHRLENELSRLQSTVDAVLTAVKEEI